MRECEGVKKRSQGRDEGRSGGREKEKGRVGEGDV